jgi:hypothetical protein
MKKSILSAALTIALLGILVLPGFTFASNSATQNASTTSATSIQIKDQSGATNVTTITFPAGAPLDIVSNPYNNQNTQSLSQSVGEISRPVATLVNTGGLTYTIWYNISTFTNGVVNNESYKICNSGAIVGSQDAIDQPVTFDTTTSTSTSIDAATTKDFYLKISLSSAAGKSGSSTITILGEN